MKRHGVNRLGIILALGLASAAHAQAPAPAAPSNRIQIGAKYSQSDAVKARFPDVAIALTAPSLAKSPVAMTTQAEMLAFLNADIARSPQAALLTIGKSQQGRDIPAILFTKDGAKTLEAARAAGRPNVWFIGQQHGDEHAGGEAMLAFAHRIATGALPGVTDTMNVIIVPRANPDGAANDKRGSANGADLNRDHVLMTLDETRAIHAAMAALPPDVVFDHHEFSVANRWVEKFGGVQKADAMLLSATHPMITPEIRAIGNELFLSRVEKDLGKFGLTSIVYMTTSYERNDPLVSTGGAAPGIARNAFGLAGAISYLVETRGVGIGLEGWQRRVATHVVIAESVLAAVRDGGAPLFARLDAARKQAAQSKDALPVQFKLKDQPFALPLVQPDNGADIIANVTLRDSREISVTSARERPVAYAVTADMAAVADRLKLNGVKSCTLGAATEANVEGYFMAAPPKPTNREAINPEQTVKVELKPERRTLPAGTLIIPMQQAAAGIITAAMEPDSPGSMVGVGLLPVDGNLAPVFRVKTDAGQIGCN